MKLATWLGFRYQPEVVLAHRLIEDGALGAVLGAQLSHHLYKAPHLQQEGTGRWQGRRETSGGGVLITNAIHYLDWLLYLADEAVVEVSATQGALAAPSEVEDSLAMWIRFANGAMATVNASSAVAGLYRLDQVVTELRIWGTEGHLSLTPPAQFYSTRRMGSLRPDRWHDLRPLPRLNEPNLEFIERFADAVLEGRDPEITGEDGLRVQEVIEAAYASAQAGHPVKVGEPR